MARNPLAVSEVDILNHQEVYRGLVHFSAASEQRLCETAEGWWQVIDLPVKVAVLSHILPPSPSGQAMVLYRLLRQVRPDDYCLISREDYCGPGWHQADEARLPARYYQLRAKQILPVPDRRGIRAICRLPNWLGEFVQKCRAVFGIIRHERCQALVACSGDIWDLPVGYFASRLAGVSFYAYIFDDYVRQWTGPRKQGWARRVAPWVMRGAAGVIVPNEFLRAEYQQRYGIEPVVIHNPCEAVEDGPERAWPANAGEIGIVYTGAVYGAHYDAFRNLLAALKMIDQPEIKLHLYTAQPAAELEREHICGPIVYHPHLPPSAVVEVQRQADILFLPLAFHSPFPEVIRTSAPGKMGEYLASGRPVLAHAPADSFVSWYFRTFGVGAVVDRDDPSVLAQAIRQIMQEPDLRRKWRELALHRAQLDFSPGSTRARFLNLLGTRTSG